MPKPKPTLETLHPDCKRAVLRAHQRDQREWTGDMHDLLAMVGQDVWQTAIAHQKQRTAKAKMTPRERAMRGDLATLTNAVLVHLHQLDEAMKLPPTVSREKTIAALANQLDKVNDMVRYFTLGVDYRKDTKSPVPHRDTGLDEVFVIRVGTDANHLYLVRDVQHRGLWAIRKMVGGGTATLWTRKKEWEIEERPLTKAFVKRAR